MTETIAASLRDLLHCPLPSGGNWRDGINRVLGSIICLNAGAERAELKPHAFAIRQSHAELVMLVAAVEALAGGAPLDAPLEVKMESSFRMTNGETLKHLIPALIYCAETLEQIDPMALRLAHAEACAHSSEDLREIGHALSTEQLEGLVFLVYDMVDAFNDHPASRAIRQEQQRAGSGARSH